MAASISAVPNTSAKELEKIDLGNGVVLELVLLTGGTCLMGSPEGEESRLGNEGPQHQVTISEFRMGKFPVTQAQWKVVAGWSKVNRDLKSALSKFKGENRPVERVSW